MQASREVQQKVLKGCNPVLSYNSIPTSKHTLPRALEKLAGLASVHRIKIHALRHSHASLLISMGENPLLIKERLGYENIQTTLGTYGHLYPNSNLEVANKLTGVLTYTPASTFAGLKTIVNAENRFMLLLDIYEKYWHTEKVISVPKEDFVNDIEAMAKKNGHRVDRQIGEAIYEASPQTVTLRPNNTFTQLASTNCAQLLRQSIQATNNIITEMDSLAKTLPEYQVVSSMNGVGPKTRSRLIAEIGDVTRFRNAGCLVAFCGIDAPPYQSGQFQTDNRHISKRGNKYLRKVGYEVM